MKPIVRSKSKLLSALLHRVNIRKLASNSAPKYLLPLDTESPSKLRPLETNICPYDSVIKVSQPYSPIRRRHLCILHVRNLLLAMLEFARSLLGLAFNEQLIRLSGLVDANDVIKAKLARTRPVVAKALSAGFA